MCAGDLLDQVKLRYDIKTFINVGVMGFSLVEAAFLKHTAAHTGAFMLHCNYFKMFLRFFKITDIYTAPPASLSAIQLGI